MSTVDGMVLPRWKWTSHGKAKYDPKSKQINNASQCYQKINIHLVFACKQDGCHKAWLVAAGNLPPDPIDLLWSSYKLGH